MSSRPALRLFYLVVPAAVLLVAITMVSAMTSKSPTSVTSNTTRSTNCTRLVGASDSQINQCLAREIDNLQSRLAHAVLREEQVLVSGSLASIQRAQADFEHYLRAECLAEAAPYRGGSIVPIVYGSCEVGLLHERLSLVVRQVLATAPH